MNKTSSARSRRGMYTAAVSALVVAIVIVFNLALGGLPAGALEFDISGKDLYTVTEQSVSYLKTLDKDVNIVVLSQTEAIDKHLLKLINNYARLSPHLKLQFIDPVLDPTALTTYSAKENNIVVKCDATNKAKTLNLAGVQGYSDGLILYDAQAYQYGQLNPVALDAEGQLTSAVNYVTNTAVNKLYTLTGHGEAALGADALEAISKVNIQAAQLNLMTAKSIPADCQVILCNNPTNDVTTDELGTLGSFLRSGGKLVLMLDNPTLTNFNALMADYGLQMQNGFIGDNDRSYQSLYAFLPVLSGGSDVTAEISSLNVLVHNTRGMLQVTPQRRASQVMPFLTTSDSGVLATDQNTTTTGKYILGAVATETFADKQDVQTRFTVITSLDIAGDGFKGLANITVFTNAIVKNYKDVQNISIPSRSMSITPITVPNPAPWVVLFVGIIPLGLLACGIVYWARRRNR
jgi:ABC-2 type transport system permease protein